MHRAHDDAPVSLKGDYDGARVVTTPLSLRACAEEGIMPRQLVKPERDDQAGFKRALADAEELGDGSGADATKPRIPKPPPVAAEKDKLKGEHLERQRNRLIKIAKERYVVLQDKVAKGMKIGGLKPVPPTADKTPPRGDGEQTDFNGALPDINSPRGGIASLSSALKEDCDLEVAKTFLVLKQASEKRTLLAKNLKLKEEKVRNFQATQRELRETKSQEIAVKQEESRQRILNTFVEQNKTREARTQRKMREKESKIEQAMEASGRMKRRKMVDPNKGEKEREFAAKVRQERLDKIANKIEHAKLSAGKMAEVQERDRELKAFANDLVCGTQGDQNDRAQRMAAFRQQQIEQRLAEQQVRKAKVVEEKQAMLKERMLRREAVARRKELIADFVADHEGEENIPVPDWLRGPVRKLASRGEAIANSPPGQTRPNFNNNQHVETNSNASSLTKKSPRNKHNFVSDKAFTIGSAEPNPKVAYPEWMYQRD